MWRLFGNVGRGLVSMFELTLANYAGAHRDPDGAATTRVVSEGWSAPERSELSDPCKSKRTREQVKDSCYIYCIESERERM